MTDEVSNVTEFRKHTPKQEQKTQHEEQPSAVFTCPHCSCQSWYICADMTAECTNCKSVLMGEGKWVERVPEYDPTKVEPANDASVTMQAYGDQEFARRSVMGDLNRMLEKGTLCMVAGYDVNGFGRSWFGAFTDDQRDWCIEKLDALVDHLENTDLSTESGFRTIPAVQMSDTPHGDKEQGEFNYGAEATTQE